MKIEGIMFLLILIMWLGQIVFDFATMFRQDDLEKRINQLEKIKEKLRRKIK